MKILLKIRAVLTEEGIAKPYLFILFSSALIFALGLWRQRLVSLPLDFSFNIFGVDLGSHIICYLFSFIEVPLYAACFVLLVFKLCFWLKARSGLVFDRIFRLISVNCLWFYVLAVNYYITNAYTQGYPNPFIGNSPNPYSLKAPFVFPLDFIGVTVWFSFFIVLATILILKGVKSLLDEAIFKYLAVFLGGLSLAVFLSFIFKASLGDYFFFWYFSVILTVWFIYDYLSKRFKSVCSQTEVLFAAFFFLLVLLPLGGRVLISFDPGIWFYLAIFLLAAGIIYHFLRNSRSKSLAENLKFLVLYLGVPILIFVFFFYPRIESTIIPQHTANMFYFPYEGLENSRVLLRDYPFIYRGFLCDTGFISFFKLFGISIYRARVFLRLLEPVIVIIFYFVILRFVPWYFALISLLLIRTNHIWFNFTHYNGDWPTHMRYLYSDLLILALVLFFQKRRKLYLFFSFTFLPLTLLNSPDLGYSMVFSGLIALGLYSFFNRKQLFDPKSGLKAEDKLFIAFFSFWLLIFWHIIYSLLSAIKFIVFDYLIGLTVGLVFLTFIINQVWRRKLIHFLKKPWAVVAAGLAVTVVPFVYYLLRIGSLGRFIYLMLKLPFLQLGIKSIAQAHFLKEVSYQAPVASGDIGYFILWQLPVLACYGAIIFLLWRRFMKQEKKDFVFYSIVFLALSSSVMYLRTFVLGEPFKALFSMHFSWFLAVILLFYMIRIFKNRTLIVYCLMLISFVPTIPLICSSMLKDSNLILHHNNFYPTTLDDEIKYLYQRNIDKEYISNKINGYFGSQEWFKRHYEALYQPLWANESIRITRKGFGLEKESEIDSTLWPRETWRHSELVIFRESGDEVVYFGYWLKIDQPQRVRVFICDRSQGCSFSDFHSGNDQWEFLKVRKKVKSSLSVEVGFQIEKGVFIFSEQTGPASMRIGPHKIARGRNLLAPEFTYTVNLEHLLYNQLYLEETSSYSDSYGQ